MRARLSTAVLPTALLLASTALTAPSFAQTAAVPASPVTNSAGTFGGTLPTDIGRVTARGDATPNGVTRVDIGGGLMIQEDQPKTRSTVTRDFIAKQSPTANPYQLIEGLPGANVASSDAFGLNGGNITIRGFNSDQLGLTIDGAPVNDSGNYALYPQEYLDAENIGQVSIAQGYSDLDSPHIGATGGVINIYSRDPNKKAGGYAGFSYGSNHTTREFIRLESGQIGLARGYLSYSHYENDHWRGPGGDNRDHIDGKVVIDVREQSKITLSAIYNRAINQFYVNPNLANFNQYGYSSPKNNLDSIYVAGATGNSAQGNNGYYKARINPFENLIVSAPATFGLTDQMTLDVTPYFWYGYGSGGGYTALSESGFNYGGNRIVQDLNGNGTTTDKVNYYTPSITRTYRPGVISKISYTMDNQKFVAGYWYEAAFHKQYGTATPLNADGSPLDAFAEGNNLIIQSGPLAGQKFQKRDTITNTRTNTLFAGDTISLFDDRLTLDVGVKQAFISRHGENHLPSGTYATITPYKSLQDSETSPVFGVNYKLDTENSLFGGLSTSFRTPSNFTLFDSVGTTSINATNGYSRATTYKPERAIHLELGHRYQSDVLNTSVSAFAYHFQSRQFSTTILDPAGGNGTISSNINAGNTTNYGVDFEMGTRRINNFRPYMSAELQRATLDGDIQASGKIGSTNVNDYLPTRGKRAPNTPEFSAFVGIDYDNGNYFGNFNVKYTGPQYSTFMNDERIPGYARANAAIGYRFDDIAFAQKPTIQLNLLNITDQINLTQAAGVQTNAAAVTGRRGSTIAKSGTPSYYVGQGFAAIVTLSSGF